MQKEQIVNYYDTCETDYRLLWDLDHSHAMHAGYWDTHTRSLRDALRRENEVLAEIANIKKGEHILDAGCGVGGSAIFLAQTYDCHVIGITLSAKQAQTATDKASQLGLQDMTTFKVMDYTCTDFPSQTFDVVWGMESICHASDKRLFIKEAARLLKPAGRLIVADGFAKKPPRNLKDQEQMDCWLKGWGVQALDQVEMFENSLKSEGFKNIFFRDITMHVLPSSRRLYWYSWPAVPLSKIGEWLGWRLPSQTANLHSARCQYQTLKKELWQYGIFYSEKGAQQVNR
jgi:cyclopropane fatty-acyl-phospholipid synthase-like methyltransferase